MTTTISPDVSRSASAIAWAIRLRASSVESSSAVIGLPASRSPATARAAAASAITATAAEASATRPAAAARPAANPAAAIAATQSATGSERGAPPHDLDEDQENDEPEENGEPELERIALRRELGLELASLAGQHFLNIGNAGPDAAREIAVLEARRNGVLDDDPRQRIGHHALDAIAG